MSNPLLRPSDDRFQRPDVRDAGGKNRFSDEASAAGADLPANDAYASSASDEAQPYAARYSVQQTSHATFFLFLGGIAWGAAAMGAFSFTGLFDVGWLAPLIGVVPAGAAWLLAHEELKAIRAGAISSAAQPQARQAFWLGLLGLLACFGVVAAMISRAMHWLPDL
jgi:hypothetical protein